jgi:two-component system response regulator NreC
MTLLVLPDEREGPRPVNKFRVQAVNGSAKSQRKERWRVVVLGCSAISSEGMAAILGRDSRFELCGAVHQQQAAQELVDSNRPDLVVVELNVESAESFRSIKNIVVRSPETRILAISKHAERVYAERALRAGASGYFIKSGSAHALLQAIEALLSSGPGERSPNDSQNIAETVGQGLITKSELSSLSERELEVFAFIAAGHGVGQIAEELGVSRKTVETHCEHIKLKLNYADAKELKRGARKPLETQSGALGSCQ